MSQTCLSGDTLPLYPLQPAVFRWLAAIPYEGQCVKFRAYFAGTTCLEAYYPQVRRAQISAAVWQAGLPPRRVKGAYLRFSKSTRFSTVAQDRGEGALVASQPRSRYAPIPEPEPNSLPTTSRPPSGPLQAYYWLTDSQLIGNHSDVDPIHIGVVA